MKKATVHGGNSIVRSSIGDTIYYLAIILLILFVTFLCIYPLWFTIIASLSDSYAVYLGKVTLWPVDFTTEAYKLVVGNNDIWMGYANSIFYTTAGTMFNLFLTIPCAYALSKKRMLGRGIITTLFIIAMYFSGGMIPSYILMSDLGLINKRLTLIIVAGLSIYNVVIARTYFMNNIPDELYESAHIDGANEFRIFFSMVLSLSKPIIAVIALYYAVAHWSNYFNAMIYITDNRLQPLQIILQRILIYSKSVYDKAQMQDVDPAYLAELERRAHMATTLKFSVVFISSAPMLIIYPFIQKYFVKGIMIGSLKG